MVKGIIAGGERALRHQLKVPKTAKRKQWLIYKPFNYPQKMCWWVLLRVAEHLM